jgi:predicted cobalt transporter CbtA
VDAVTAALEAAGLTVYLGGAPSGVSATDAQPFVVLYPEPGRAQAASLADDRTLYSAVVQLTCVGLTAEQAMSLSDRAAAVMSVVLTVAGRVSWKPEPLDGQPVQRDDDVVPPNYYAAARYRIRSIPA